MADQIEDDDAVETALMGREAEVLRQREGYDAVVIITYRAARKEVGIFPAGEMCVHGMRRLIEAAHEETKTDAAESDCDHEPGKTAGRFPSTAKH